MAAPGDIYERELKYLLTGDKKVIGKMIKTCDEDETSAYNSMFDEPFVVIRAAGSLGVDLVALRWDFSFPIEVKSSAEEIMHFSRNPRLTEQAEKMKNECSKSHLLPVYAFRLKSVRGDPWRIFTLPLEEDLQGNMGLLQRRVPEIRVNDNGNYIMKWSDGMKLSEFIQYMSFTFH
jgi:Holliday junction resolvase